MTPAWHHKLASRLSPRQGWLALGRWVYGTPLYGLTLMGRVPAELRGTPPDAWPGNAALGSALIAEEGVAGEGAALHRFDWLRHLRAQGSDEARQRARHMIERWIDTNGRWHPLSWRPHILGERLVNWFASYGFVCTGADEGFRRRFFQSTSRQVRHLSRVAASEAADARRILAAKGLIYSGICMPGQEENASAGIRLLEREMERQILADGGHFQRSPDLQLALLRHFVDIRETLRAAQVEIPVPLQGTIDRMAPMLRCLRHADGRLALFNDSTEEDERYIDMVLAQAGARGKALSSAPHSGFHRLVAGRTVLLADLGAPPEVAGDDRTHAGTLGFELSVGKERLVVNCGAHGERESPWHDGLRATAAHSTLTVDDTNSTELLPGGGLGRRPATVTCTRREAEGNMWIEAGHDGYRACFGLIHDRHLYLAADGSDLRGRDMLSGSGGSHFAVRFHLHPAVQASLVQGGQAVLLRLPRGGGWRFNASGGAVTVEESVYCGRREEMKRSTQIVVAGPLEGDGADVKWRFSRIGP